VLNWAWKHWTFWRDWSHDYHGERECPRSCSPMIMLKDGKGQSATILTAMEWGLSRETATERIRERCATNRKAYLWVILTGSAFVALSLGSSIYSLIREPSQFLSLALIDLIMCSVGGFLIYRGIKGYRCFKKS
jgi:hypothetical protein